MDRFKKTARWVFLVFGIFMGLTLAGSLLLMAISGDPDYKSPLNKSLVNDITKLNPIQVDRVVRPSTVMQISELVKNSKSPISIGGGHYSQGGQTAIEDSLHLDMRGFNQILEFKPASKEITVQTGITWREIQSAIDPYNLSVRIMQTYSNFTVGGSLSVNVHGRYIGEGPLVSSVKSIKIVLADGSVKFASPAVNPELFYGAIGGYGGLGVIVEATLLLADNTKIERKTKLMPIASYADYFKKHIRDHAHVVFHNADIYPPDYTELRDVSWYETELPLTIETRLIPKDEKYTLQPAVLEFIADTDIGKRLRQKILDPFIYRHERVVWRNYEASYDVRELEPKDRKKNTYVLREYFVPVEKFDRFTPLMKNIFQRHDVDVLNVSIRHAHKDPGTILAWAKGETFAFVVYYRQGTDQKSKDAVAIWSREMIDAAISVGGSYYLPYQLYESSAQFKAAYPGAEGYFALKRRLDPDYRFQNKLWQHLYPEAQNKLSVQKISGYAKPVEQSLLSIPEWYLVFNPVEYAGFLEKEGNPSEFPFYRSIQQYWRHYDRVRALTDRVYPENPEYLTMLRVIGLSTTAEYMWKGIYENTVGRATFWISGNQLVAEDKTIAAAQTAYSKFIYDTAWYEFKFSPWVRKIWSENDFFGSGFVRKTERKIFFTAEFGIKALYSKIIGIAAKTAYEENSGIVYSRGFFKTNRPHTLPDQVTVNSCVANECILALPRWGRFTESAIWLAANGFDFKDIAGNNSIVVSSINDLDSTHDGNGSIFLFEDALVSDPSKKRTYELVPVTELAGTLSKAEKSGAGIEHVYDF